METTEVGSRSDFAFWAIQRAQEIVTTEGAAFAMAARDMNEAALATTAADLGKAIADAMLEVFDGLIEAYLICFDDWLISKLAIHDSQP